MDGGRKKRIQYHPGYCAAVELELGENRKDLSFEEEFRLNSLPRQVDLLVIRRNNDEEIKSGLGKIFRRIWKEQINSSQEGRTGGKIIVSQECWNLSER